MSKSMMSIASTFVEDQWPGMVAAAGAIAAFAALRATLSYFGTKYSDTSATQLCTPHRELDNKSSMGEWTKYDKHFQQNKGEGIDLAAKADTPGMVDTFYNLVTDIYEWGWGHSFHFSPGVKGASYADHSRLHEEALADAIDLKEGMTALDAGCGVGGPLLNIAKHSKASVTGITINEYQVNKANGYIAKSKLPGTCRVVQGNFLEMPFEDNSFDAAYSIEATCHAPELVEVYKEIFRVLKPGQKYATYEWVTTHLYDKSNPYHVEIIDKICHGNALPELRTYQEAIDAAKEAGFEVVLERDVAPPPSLPWWTRLAMGKLEYNLNRIVVGVLCALRLAPKGTNEVHNMLVNVAHWLMLGGKTGIFTPMHLIVCKKPEN